MTSGNKLYIVFILLLFGNVAFSQITRLGGIDIRGNGLWNWDQRLDQGWENCAVNGDMEVWTWGTDTIPYGWNHAYAEVRCDVTREETNAYLGNYAMRITANGSELNDSYTDYWTTFRKEWHSRYMTIGFWYFCSSNNNANQRVTWSSGASGHGVQIDLQQDNEWHWAKLTTWVDQDATYLFARFLVNSNSTNDTDDYMIIDGLSIYGGRVLPRWMQNSWDALYANKYFWNGTDINILDNKVIFDPDNTGITLKNYAGVFQLRNEADDDYAQMRAQAIVLERAVDSNNNHFVLQNGETIDATHIAWKYSVRSNNEDLLLYGWDGSSIKNFIFIDWTGEVKITPSATAANYSSVVSDGSINFGGTGRLELTKKTANGATIRNAHGTTASSVSDLQTAHDGNAYTLVEEAETPGMDVEIDFTSVTAFNWVQILARYKGSASHTITVQLEITPFNGTAWHTHGTLQDQPADQNYENLSFFVPDDTVYINSGVVKVRLVHEMAGTPSHELIVDTVTLY